MANLLGLGKEGIGTLFKVLTGDDDKDKENEEEKEGEEEEEEEEDEETKAAREQEQKAREERLHKLREEQKRRKLSKATFDAVSWPFPDWYKNKLTVRLDEIVKLGIPRKNLVEYLNQENRESESCRSLPFALFLVIIYSLSAAAHENGQVVSDAQNAIEHTIREYTNFAYTEDMGHKSLHDVSSHTDFWSWMRLGFLPTVFKQQKKVTWNTTAPIPADDPQRGMFLEYNRIMGGVRMQMQQSVPPEEGGCITEADLWEAYGLRCTGGLGNELDPEQWDIWHFGEPSEDGVAWLLTYKDIAVLLDEVQALEYAGFASNLTTRIELDIPIYNAEYGLYVLTKVSLFFARTGHIWKAVVSSSCFADWWPKLSYILIDIIFILSIAYIVGKELLEARHMMVTHGPKRCFKNYLKFWNLVDWFAVVSGSVIIALFRVNYNFTALLNAEATALGSANPLDMESLATGEGENLVTGEDNYILLCTNVLAALETELEYAHNFRYAMASYPLVIILRVFKAFSAQARLSVVTDTLVYASVDLMHFMIVFLSVFGAYVISGVTLFGREMETLVTPSRAFNQLFRALLGDLDWEDLRQAGRYEAMSFYVVFRLLLSQVMFNLLISIIMESYEKTKLAAVGAEMIWEELGQELRMRFGRNNLVPYWRVVNALKYDEKVDTLRKVLMKPRNPKTSFVEVKNMNGKLYIQCFQQYPNMDLLSVEQESTAGTVVVVDGRGGFHEILDGKIKEFPIQLDDHFRFHYYYDSAFKGVATNFDLMKAVKDTEQGKSALGLVNIEYLLKAVDDMDVAQANQVIEDAIDDFYVCNHLDPGPEELCNMVLHLDHRTSKCLRAVMGEKKRQKVVATTPTGPDSELAIENSDTGQNGNGEKHEKVRTTVGHELSKCFEDVIHAHHESQASLDKLDPDHYRKTDIATDEVAKSATFEELHIGQDVKILNDMRRIISTCFDAGLSVENSEWRKESAGCYGKVTDVDDFDKTVCVHIAGIGKMWYSPGAIECPEGQAPWGPPLEIELRRREQEKEDEKKREEEELKLKRKALEDHFALARRKLQLELALGEVKPTADEAEEMREQLQRRVEKQQSAKAKAERAIEALEKKQARLMQEGKAASALVRQDQEKLHDLSETRNEYFDTMRWMVAENQELRRKLEEEQEDLAELQAVASADARGVELYEKDIKETISELGAQRARARKAEQTELAWLAGKADALVKLLKKDGRVPDAVPHLLALRDLSLEASSALQDI